MSLVTSEARTKGKTALMEALSLGMPDLGHAVRRPRVAHRERPYRQADRERWLGSQLNQASTATDVNEQDLRLVLPTRPPPQLCSHPAESLDTLWQRPTYSTLGSCSVAIVIGPLQKYISHPDSCHSLTTHITTSRPFKIEPVLTTS